MKHFPAKITRQMRLSLNTHQTNQRLAPDLTYAAAFISSRSACNDGLEFFLPEVRQHILLTQSTVLIGHLILHDKKDMQSKFQTDIQVRKTFRMYALNIPR